LTRPFDRHLDSDELDRLVSLHGTSASDTDQLSESALGEAQRHVESCQACSRKLQMHKFVHSEISRMRVPNPSPPTPECLGDAGWLDVAAGLLPEAKTRELMKHAAQCGHCGPLLKNAAENIADEATPSEEALLASLKSARPEWRKDMAATLRDSAREGQPSTPWWRALLAWPTPAYAFAGVAAIAVVAWIGVRALHHPSADQLLAQAYTEHRTLEVRIPGAKYAPVQAQRGTERSDFDKPLSLLTAEGLIGENLRKNPNDPVWLQARARADLLDGNYDAAIKSLQRAREARPDDPSLLTDLGSAYFQQALADPQNHSADLGAAYERLSEALQKLPDEPVALFNRAIVAESQFHSKQAEEDWEHYLRVDASGPWSDEARDRLKRLRERGGKWEQNRLQPLLSPSQIVDQYKVSQAGEIVDQRVEEYLHEAVLDWLPRTFPANLRQASDTQAQSALVILAEITRLNHHDTWLEDLLGGVRDRTFALAVDALSMALSANDRGNYDEALRQSLRAERLFNDSRNFPGSLRARYEELFALQFIRNGQHCARPATLASQIVLHTSYTWLQPQILLEESACSTTNADVGRARTRIAQALRLSRTSGYGQTLLRCLTFSANDAALAGDLRVAWKEVLEGLDIFWSGNYPELRGYSLYDPQISAAEFASQPNLQVAAWKQAIALIDSDPDVLQRGMAHFYLAQAAMDAHLLSTFDREYKEYNRLLALAPKGLAEKSDRSEVELITAKLEARRGDVGKAQERLIALLPVIQESGNTYRASDFYATLGELDLQTNADGDADRYLRSGLAVTEQILATLHTDKERMEWEQKASPLYRALVEEYLRKGDATGALETWEWYLGAAIRRPDLSGSSTGYAFDPRLSEVATMPRLNAVTEQLPRLRHQTVVSYAMLHDGLAIWAYDDRGIFSTVVHRDPKEIDLLARHFLEVCADPDSDVKIVHKYGVELYHILIAPIESKLESGRALIVEADGALTLVPFEALVDRTSHYVGEGHSVVSSLGLYYCILLRPMRVLSHSDAALLVAVPAPRGFSPLPNLESETDLLAGRFSEPRVLKNSQATLQAVMDGLRTTSIFYFAGHAVASPARAGLLMADIDPTTGDPRVLTARLLEPALLGNLQIAILAACDTGQGENGSYTDVTSLARAFVRGGVPSVVASRWKLISGAPERLALPFVFPQRPSHTTVHPYYWASLNQFGGLDIQPDQR